MEYQEKLISARIYKYLSECFYYPDEEQLLEIADLASKTEGDYKELSIKCKNNLKELQLDYARLFIGPFKVLSPPYGSVYLENGRKTFGDSTTDALKYYKTESLNVDLKEPPDHIAIELEFMYYLLSREIDALNNRDLKTAEMYVVKQKQFLTTYISSWVEEFADSVLKNAESDFYKDLSIKLVKKVKSDLKAYY